MVVDVIVAVVDVIVGADVNADVGVSDIVVKAVSIFIDSEDDFSSTVWSM